MAVDFDSFLNASRHERTSRRQRYRNGHRSRNLLTTVGTVDIRVPRDREDQYQPGLFERYQRVDRSLEETIRAMFLCGVSTCKVGDILDVLCGEPALAGFREVRRRLKVMGCFQNSKSRPGPTLSGCDRIIYAIFNYFNTKWTRNAQKIKAIKNVTDQAA